MSSLNESGTTAADRLAAIATAHQRLLAAAHSMTEEQAHSDVELPGWTRAHLLTHLGDLSAAFARQARYAVTGRTVEVYAGGREARNRSIEVGHTRPVEELREHLHAGLAELDDAWSHLTPADWQRPSGYREQPQIAIQFAWWREVEIHSVDLLIGYHTDDWTPSLSAHVINFLLPRLPAGRAITLVATDTGEHWRLDEPNRNSNPQPSRDSNSHPDSGPGPQLNQPGPAGDETPLTVRGPVRSLAAWLSGRPTGSPPVADGFVALPELGDWP